MTRLIAKALENEITFHPSFRATTFLHPSTYLNKILVGGKSGELQLWNVRTWWVSVCTKNKADLLCCSSLVHTFAPPSPSTPSAITALVQSPAIDVVGIGYLDGTIRLFDIRQGDLVMQLKVDDGSVTGLAFRMGRYIIASLIALTHRSDGPHVLASSSSAGSIAAWDLSKGGRVIHVQRRAHEQSVTGLEWVNGQPLLVSSSGDNSLKVGVDGLLWKQADFALAMALRLPDIGPATLETSRRTSRPSLLDPLLRCGWEGHLDGRTRPLLAEYERCQRLEKPRTLSGYVLLFQLGFR